MLERTVMLLLARLRVATSGVRFPMCVVPSVRLRGGLGPPWHKPSHAGHETTWCMQRLILAAPVATPGAAPAASFHIADGQQSNRAFWSPRVGFGVRVQNLLSLVCLVCLATCLGEAKDQSAATRPTIGNFGCYSPMYGSLRPASG